MGEPPCNQTCGRWGKQTAASGRAAKGQNPLQPWVTKVKPETDREIVKWKRHRTRLVRYPRPSNKRTVSEKESINFRERLSVPGRRSQREGTTHTMVSIMQQTRVKNEWSLAVGRLGISKPREAMNSTHSERVAGGGEV